MTARRSFVPAFERFEGRLVCSSAVRPPRADVSVNWHELGTDPTKAVPLKVTSIRTSYFGPRKKAPFLDVHRANLAALERTQPRVVFFGDSVTMNWQWEGRQAWQRYFALKSALNLGMSGDHTQSLLWRLQDGEIATRPRVAVVLVGINNLQHGNAPDETARGIFAVVRTIRDQSPNTRVLVLGLLPTQDLELSGRVRELNRILQRRSGDVGASYLDVGPRLRQPNDEINPAYLTRNVHLTSRGYAAVAPPIAARITRLITSAD